MAGFRWFWSSFRPSKALKLQEMACQASESFASDASAEAKALADRCGQHDAEICDKLTRRELGRWRLLGQRSMDFNGFSSIFMDFFHVFFMVLHWAFRRFHLSSPHVSRVSHPFSLDPPVLGAEHSKMDRVSASVSFRTESFAWHAPVSLGELLELRQRLPRAMFLLGDTAKGIRAAAYEVANGRAQDVISIRNAARLGRL